jgi:excisionase family DNA binding protein
MSHQTTPTESKYRLASDRAAIVRITPPGIMDLKEAAAYLAVSPRTIRQLIERGKLKSTRVGAKIVLRREWLDAMLGA